MRNKKWGVGDPYGVSWINYSFWNTLQIWWLNQALHSWGFLFVGWLLDLDMTKRSIMYGLAYGISIGVGGAVTFSIALESLAIGISRGLGSGISLGMALALLLNKGKTC